MEAAGTVRTLEAVLDVWAEDIWEEAVSTQAMRLLEAGLCWEECYSCKPESSDQQEERGERVELPEPEEPEEWLE